VSIPAWFEWLMTGVAVAVIAAIAIPLVLGVIAKAVAGATATAAIMNIYARLPFADLAEEEAVIRVRETKDHSVQTFHSMCRIICRADLDNLPQRDSDKWWLDKMAARMILTLMALSKMKLVSERVEYLTCADIVERWHHFEALDEFDLHRYIDFLMTGKTNNLLSPYQKISAERVIEHLSLNRVDGENDPNEEEQPTGDVAEAPDRRIRVTFIRKRPFGKKHPKQEMPQERSELQPVQI